MGFRSLRVINEDWVAPGNGFGLHPHNDMEILCYVLEGALEHKDTLGTVGAIRPGDVYRMSAGTGIAHSEYNPSDSEPVHLLQIWILPDRAGLPPSYEQRRFPVEEKRGRLRLVGAPDGRDGAVILHQDVELYASVLDAGQRVTHALRPGRGVWLQVARGVVTLNGQALTAGDGAAVSDEPALEIAAAESAEFLLFDLGPAGQ